MAVFLSTWPDTLNKIQRTRCLFRQGAHDGERFG